MPQAEALAAFNAYRHAVRSAKTATLNSEDAQIARAYKAVAAGKPVVNLAEAFKTAGYDAAGLPRLAVSRADYKRVQLDVLTEWRWDVTVQRSASVPRSFEIWPASEMGPTLRGNTPREGRVFLVPIGTILPPNDLKRQAIVPNIPPHLRPPHDLSNYHLLWEPEWLKIPRPPKDPALLKHLGGPLYAVLATWDLTPVEQAVLGITRA